MIEKAICNASPLIFLAKINKLNLLESYTLYVPTQVRAEIQKGFVSKKKNTGQMGYRIKEEILAEFLKRLRE